MRLADEVATAWWLLAVGAALVLSAAIALPLSRLPRGWRGSPLALAALVALPTIWVGELAWDSWETESWPAVRGRLLESDVDPGIERLPSGRIDDVWWVELQYEYFVGGRRRVGRKWSCVGRSRFFEERRAWEAVHALRDEPWLRVYHDPEDPARSCLMQGGRSARECVNVAAGLLLLTSFLTLTGLLAGGRFEEACDDAGGSSGS